MRNPRSLSELDAGPLTNDDGHIAMAGFLYTVKARPTTYGGVIFRSRLDATWAAFFDLAGLPWQYEPIDLDGWVPDFVIRSPAHDRDVLVEVKPISRLNQLEPAYLTALTNREGRFHIAIFGLSPFRTDPWVFPDGYSVDFGCLCWLSFQRKDGTHPRFETSLNDEWYTPDPVSTFKTASNITRWKSPTL